MLKTSLYCGIDTEISHNATNHHVFFFLCSQILKQTTLFFERTAYGLDKPFFIRHRLKLGINLKLIIPDRESGIRSIIMLYINNFYALFSSCSNQLFDITNKLSELI